MSANSDPLPRDLAAALERHLDVVPAKSLADLLGGTAAAFLAAPRLTLASHFTVQPALLIFDRRVRTLGLVEVLPVQGNSETLEKHVRESVDRATYVRHLLLTDRKRGDCVPLAVELVLAVHRTEERESVVGAALREIARHTSYLHAIGVSELYHEGKPFAEDSLRRAFPWLLQASRRWLASLGQGRPPVRKPVSLTLHNYRLPGSRVLNLAGKTRLHLVHGPNGSGKSSLAEALELALTGTIERLDLAGEKDYEKILTNRGAIQPATILVTFRETENDPPAGQLRGVACNPADALSPGIKATGFRLDQTVMDRLSRRGDEERAVTFLEAFFPEEEEISQGFREAEQRRREALDALGKIMALPPAEDEKAREAFLAHFSAVDPPQGVPDPKLFDEILPLPLATLREIAVLAPGLQALTAGWQTSRPAMERLGDELARLDEELRKAAPAVFGTLGTLRTAWSILQGMAGWVARPRQATGKKPEDVLNEWLELCALVDLAEKQIQLARSLAEARQRGWDPARVAAGDLMQRAVLLPEDLARLESARDRWGRERSRLAEEVGQLRRRAGSTDAATITAPSVPDPEVSDEQIAALDAAGPWFLPAGEAAETAPFGKLINDVVTSGEAQSYGNITLGGPTWVEDLRQRIDPLLQACIRAETLVSAPDAAARLEILRDALRKHRSFKEAGARARETFVEKIRPEAGSAADHRLDDAINELMALFTPTRWAYQDVALSYKAPAKKDEKGGLQLRLRANDGTGARADVLLNTAELNIFTLALFLLCSVRIDNRLGLLVLDDPLQNMDELTVVTVARGLARIAEILPPSWQLLLLFHGEDDLERFRQEVPGAIYRLPWLTSTMSAETPPIDPEPDHLEAGLQPLTELIADK